MDSQKLQHLCQILILIGTVLAAVGTYGHFYFGKDIRNKKLSEENKGAVMATGDPNNQMNIGNIERIEGDLVQNQQKTTVINYNSTPEDIDPSVKSFFQMPRYKKGIVQIGGTFRFEKSKVFLYSISPQVIDNRTVLLLKVANEDSERVYYLDEPDAIPKTIFLKVMNRRYLIWVEGYDANGIQVRTFTEK